MEGKTRSVECMIYRSSTARYHSSHVAATGCPRPHGATVEVNAARNALQVVGCTGTIMAHVALKNEEMVRLALAD